MKFSACLHPVGNRGVPPLDFLAELVKFGQTAPDEIFASRKDDPGEVDIYTSVKTQLGPYTGTPHRRAVMLEVLRVLAGFESAWDWKEDFDRHNPDENTPMKKSAGIFQESANSMYFGADLRALMAANGVSERDGDGFRDVMRSDHHQVVIEYAARLLRHLIRCNGPIARGEIHQHLRRDAVAEFQANFGAGDEQASPAPVEPVPAPSGTLVMNHWPREADAGSFFGYPPNLTLVHPPYPMRMNYDGAWHPITQINCNMKVAASLRRILAAILAHYGSPEAISAVGLDVYDGCYNDRSVRGDASKRSMHTYGAAIDFDAEHNPLGATWGRMPAAVVAMFKAEGWRWGGDYTGRRDWMHFECCV